MTFIKSAISAQRLQYCFSKRNYSTAFTSRPSLSIYSKSSTSRYSYKNTSRLPLSSSPSTAKTTTPSISTSSPTHLQTSNFSTTTTTTNSNLVNHHPSSFKQTRTVSRTNSARSDQFAAYSSLSPQKKEAKNVKMSPIALSTFHSNNSNSSLDTHYTNDLRKVLGIRGLIPPVVESFGQQKERCLEQIKSKTTSIDKYMYLANLRNSNVDLFYRLLIDNMPAITPLVYTPVVGEACLKWSHIYTQPEGLYLSWADRGKLREVLDNWREDQVDITVVTDGSRILGLGDLGVNGMGIPVGKLALYTGCAGIHPKRTLPITLDLGTNNEENLKDPLYLGAKMRRVSPPEMLEFLDEMMIALNDKWPGIIVQFEDLKDPFPSLERYRNTYTCFNDDIQGTGAVILAGVMNGFKQSGIPLEEHKLVFMGAGSAAVGVAKQIVELFIKSGIPEEKARRQFWLVDSKGLVTDDRGDKLADHKLYFSRPDNDGQQFASLEEVVDYVQPTALMGLCTTGGVFTESIIRKMATIAPRPIIFPLSNPVHKAECTFDQAMEWTNEKVIFASGSPFPDYTGADGTIYHPGQGNNMYVFPGIGLGTLLCKAVHVSQEMIYASAKGLAEALNEEEHAQSWLYPNLDRIREVSVRVAREVIRCAQKENLDRNKKIQWLSDRELDEYIRESMYDPREEYVSPAGSEVGSPRGSHL